jgi:hypothetical protein
VGKKYILLENDLPDLFNEKNWFKSVFIFFSSCIYYHYLLNYNMLTY